MKSQKFLQKQTLRYVFVSLFFVFLFNPFSVDMWRTKCLDSSNAVHHNYFVQWNRKTTCARVYDCINWSLSYCLWIILQSFQPPHVIPFPFAVIYSFAEDSNKLENKKAGGKKFCENATIMEEKKSKEKKRVKFS